MLCYMPGRMRCPNCEPDALLQILHLVAAVAQALCPRNTARLQGLPLFLRMKQHGPHHPTWNFEVIGQLGLVLKLEETLEPPTGK